MKKLITILLLAALAITATFAATEDKTVILNGNVDQIDYNFALTNNQTSVTDTAYTYATEILLSGEISTTSAFIVSRSKGNLNGPLTFKVDVSADSFIGEYNGDPNYDTQVIPTITWNTTNYVDNVIANSGTIASSSTIILSSGPALTGANIAAFYLTVEGNENVPSGSYTSTITVNYSYDQ
jgi:hypothetical protein